MPDAMSIIREVSDQYGVSVETMRGKKHARLLFDARRDIYRRLREERSLSFNQIGIIMGGRDHTSIIHALNRERRARDIERIEAHKEKTKCRHDGFQQRLRGASSSAARRKRQKEERSQSTHQESKNGPPASETRHTSN